jgi:alpha-glucosidase
MSTVLERPVPSETTSPWWRSAVIYQVYPRSFADSDGDGVGDLPGVTARLPYLAELGVDAVWLSPIYRSPMADAGYDVADYRVVDPLFGRTEDADLLIAEAHRLGLRVVLDLVPNHTSDEHAWFRAALAAPAGSPERSRYLFRDGRGPAGELPPNSWRSVFGGPAWTRVTEPDGTPGQWYLHLFDDKQPDLDWTHPEVRAEFEDILRFWLDRGVDGFRVDVAHGLVKADGLPDWDHEQELLDGSSHGGERPPMWDQDGVHDIYRSWRQVLDEYDGDRMLVAEAWVEPAERLARYVRPDEMHQAFNFAFLSAGLARRGPARVDQRLARGQRHGGRSGHLGAQQPRRRPAHHPAHPAADAPRPNGIGAQDPQPDEQLGLRRGRAASLVMLGLPGSAYLYQGEELGLPEHTTLPDDVRQDPLVVPPRRHRPGRDGCRVPLPWHADRPGFGFGPTAASWLPSRRPSRGTPPTSRRATPARRWSSTAGRCACGAALGLGTGELGVLADPDDAVLSFRLRGSTGAEVS